MRVADVVARARMRRTWKVLRKREQPAGLTITMPKGKVP